MPQVTIRQARRKAGLSQTEVARRVGMSQTAYSFYESGKRTMSDATRDIILANIAILSRKPKKRLTSRPTK